MSYPHLLEIKKINYCFLYWYIEKMRFNTKPAKENIVRFINCYKQYFFSQTDKIQWISSITFLFFQMGDRVGIAVFNDSRKTQMQQDIFLNSKYMNNNFLYIFFPYCFYFSYTGLVFPFRLPWSCKVPTIWCY